MAKGPEAFRTISEAADEVGVAQHVLRFWETKFPFVQPLKRAGGRRFYRPADIDLLKAIRRLLHEDGYTIAGVQKLQKQQGTKRLTGGGSEPAALPDEQSTSQQSHTPQDALSGDVPGLLDRLRQAKAALDSALASER